MTSKFKRTIEDAKDDVRGEFSTQPLLTDGYTSGNIQKLKDSFGKGLPDEEALERKAMKIAKKKTSKKVN